MQAWNEALDPSRGKGKWSEERGWELPLLLPLVWEAKGYEEERRRSPAAGAASLTPFLPGQVPGSWDELKRTEES